MSQYCEVTIVTDTERLQFHAGCGTVAGQLNMDVNSTAEFSGYGACCIMQTLDFSTLGHAREAFVLAACKAYKEHHRNCAMHGTEPTMTLEFSIALYA